MEFHEQDLVEVSDGSLLARCLEERTRCILKILDAAVHADLLLEYGRDIPEKTTFVSVDCRLEQQAKDQLVCRYISNLASLELALIPDGGAPPVILSTWRVVKPLASEILLPVWEALPAFVTALSERFPSVGPKINFWKQINQRIRGDHPYISNLI